MLRSGWWAALAAAIAVGGQATPAAAYCRATTCSETEGTTCDPPTPSDCGTPLAWTRNCLGFAAQRDGSKQMTATETRTHLRDAFATWESADCGGGETPRVHVTDLGTVDCANVEYNDKGGNVNAIVFRDKSWPHPQGTHNIALTTVTYDSNTGAIFDADMELNSAQYTFTTVDPPEPVQYDFLSVVTHEAGHFLGLGHSKSDPNATMNAVYSEGSIDFRDLAQDDIDAICATYPPTSKGSIPDTCNPIPRHGFSPECLTSQTEGTCSFAPPADRPPTAALWLLLAAAVRLERRSRRLNRPFTARRRRVRRCLPSPEPRR